MFKCSYCGKPTRYCDRVCAECYEAPDKRMHSACHCELTFIAKTNNDKALRDDTESKSKR